MGLLEKAAQTIETVNKIEIEELSGTEYEVESILYFKRVNGRPYYLVK